MDLGRYSGQRIELILQIHVLYKSAQDLAVWVNPRIEWWAGLHVRVWDAGKRLAGLKGSNIRGD